MEQPLLQRVNSINFRDQQRRLREEELNIKIGKIKEQTTNSVCFIVFYIVMILSSGNEDWGVNDRISTKQLVWAGVFLYLLEIAIDLGLFFLADKDYIKVASIDILKGFYHMMKAAFHIYVIVKWFSKNNDWGKISSALYYSHVILLIDAFAMVAFVFWILMIIAMYLCFLCCLARRQQNQQQQNVQISQILLHATTLRMNPTQLNNEDECIICMEAFEATSQVLQLPCNSKHIFHADCIANWVQRNSCWPLWKQVINEETIREAQQRIRENGGDLENNNGAYEMGPLR